MIVNLKNYVFAAVVVSLITAVGISRWELSSVTKEYAKYKGDINEQVAAAKIEAARIAKIQDEKFQLAKSGYADSRRNLDSILAGLRDGTFVLRDDPLQFPVGGSNTVPTQATNTGGAVDPAAAAARAGQATFYEKAMMDTLQCSKLIEFVK